MNAAEQISRYYPTLGLRGLICQRNMLIIRRTSDKTTRTRIRCYAAAGFYPVGPIVTPDGHALLMRCNRPQVRLIHTRRFLVEP
jgi:hypothetical protein